MRAITPPLTIRPSLMTTPGEVRKSRFQWPRGLKRGFAVARFLGSRVRIPPGAWMSVCCECCVLSGRCICHELIIRPEESYRLWCVVECDLETSWMRRPWPNGRLLRHGRGEKSTNYRVPRCVIISRSLLMLMRSKYFAQRHVRLRLQ